MSWFKVFNISFFNQTFKGCRKRFSYVDLKKCQIHDTWKTLTLLLYYDLVVVGVWSKNFWIILPKIIICCVLLLATLRVWYACDVTPCGACRPWIFFINGVLCFLKFNGSRMEKEERWLETPLQWEDESRRSSPS